MDTPRESLNARTPPGGETSLSLLQRLRDKDGDAWQRFVHLYGPLVYSWCRRFGVTGEEAADVVQETWTSVASALERFRRDATGGTFRGWLWSITRHKLCDRARTRKGPDPVGGTTAQMLIQEIPEPEPLDEAGTETHQLLHRALKMIQPEFEERTWKAFWRTTVDGAVAADAGAELGLAANAVHQAKFRVLRRLRQEMAGLVDC
jgi:RNA polymerase sigma-70 factor (ECF subfamily)